MQLHFGLGKKVEGWEGKGWQATGESKMMEEIHVTHAPSFRLFMQLCSRNETGSPQTQRGKRLEYVFLSVIRNEKRRFPFACTLPPSIRRFNLPSLHIPSPSQPSSFLPLSHPVRAHLIIASAASPTHSRSLSSTPDSPPPPALSFPPEREGECRPSPRPRLWKKSRRVVAAPSEKRKGERGISQPSFHFLFAACPNKSRHDSNI